MIAHLIGLLVVVGLYGAPETSAGPLVTSVTCIDDKNPERSDSSWDYTKWGAGVEQWQNKGPNTVSIVDQFIALDKTAGRCMYADALICELNTTGLDIGAAWIDTAGRYKGKVDVIIKNKNHFRWVTKSETKCHGHKFRVQFFGSYPNKKITATAVLACGVPKSHPEIIINNKHDACRYNTYTTPAPKGG